MKKFLFSTLLVFVLCTTAGATVTFHLDWWGSTPVTPDGPDNNYLTVWYSSDAGEIVKSVDLSLGILTGRDYNWMQGIQTPGWSGSNIDQLSVQYPTAAAPWDVRLSFVALEGGLTVGSNNPSVTFYYHSNMGGISTVGLGDISAVLIDNSSITPLVMGATIIPEPMTIALLGLGSLLLTRKKSAF
jgi:hypothetical protein